MDTQGIDTHGGQGEGTETTALLLAFPKLIRILRVSFFSEVSV